LGERVGKPRPSRRPFASTVVQPQADEWAGRGRRGTQIDKQGIAMTNQLDGKVALITGGGSGIGRACAVRFAKEGANVCVADLDGNAATETAQLVEAAGRKAAAVQVDTTDEAAHEAMVKRCVESLGAVDVLVAAAGIGAVRVPGATSYQPHTVLSIPMDQFRRVIDVNLYGVLFSNRHVAP